MNLLIFVGNPSDEANLYVVTDKLYDAIQELLKLDEQNDTFEADLKISILLFGQDGELTNKNPEIIKTFYCQTYCQENEGMPEVKRILCLPNI